MGDSEYNRLELAELGFRRTGVLPLLLDLSALDGEPDSVVMRRFDDDRPTWLFVGRVVPNKRFEDILRTFAYFQRYIDHTARLVIVGEYRTFAPYYDALQHLVGRLGLDEVHFVGHVTPAELNSYYRLADAFVCMSEHEGFCVPLFEAIHRDLPVVAFAAAAIPYSTGEGVLLVSDKNPAYVAELVGYVLSDDGLRRRLIARQRAALELVDRDLVIESLMRQLGEAGLV